MKKKVIILMLINTICSINMSSVGAWTAQPTLTIDPTNLNILYNDGTPKSIFPVMLHSFLNQDEYRIVDKSIDINNDYEKTSRIIDSSLWYKWGFNMVYSYSGSQGPNETSKFVENCNKYNILSMFDYKDFDSKGSLFAFPDEPHTASWYVRSGKPVTSDDFWNVFTRPIDTNFIANKRLWNPTIFSEIQKKWSYEKLSYVNFDLQPYFSRQTEELSQPISSRNDPFDSKLQIIHGSTTSYSEFAEKANILAFDYYPFDHNGTLKTSVTVTRGGEQGITSVGEFTNLLKTKYPNKPVWPVIQTLWYDAWNSEFLGYYIDETVIRHLTFDAIINGADGISFWGHGQTYYYRGQKYLEKYNEKKEWVGNHDLTFLGKTKDGIINLKTDTEAGKTIEQLIWKATLYQTKELQELQENYDQILLEDNVKNSHVSNGKVNYSFKKVKNTEKYYLFITSAEEAETTVNVKIPYGFRIKDGSAINSIGSYDMPEINGISAAGTHSYINPNAIGIVSKNGTILTTTLKKYGTNIISMELVPVVSMELIKNKKNDIAAFYNYVESNTFKVQLLSPNNSTVVEDVKSTPPIGWADFTNAWSTKSILKTIPGDFNNDGYDDIAAFYNYASVPGPGVPARSPQVHLITSTAQGGSSTVGAWADYYNKWNSEAIQYALPGDFNNDGNDDIAVFYTAPATTTFPYPSPVVKLICSNGSGGRASTVEAWADLQEQWNSNEIIYAVSGDFNNDGRSDIAVFYRYVCNECNIKSSFKVHLITTDENGKSKIIMNWCDQYNISDSNPILRVVSGDFNNDGNDDIAFFYKSGKYFKVHLITSNGNGSSIIIKDWADFTNNSDFEPLLQTVAGDFNKDGHDDIAWFYNYPATNDGYSGKIHLLTYNEATQKSKTILNWATFTDNQWNPLSVFSVVAGDFIPTSRLKSKEYSENSVNPENSTNAENGIFRNYPNPFKENTSITYELKEPSFVQLKIYNNSGQEIKVLVNEFKSSGVYNTNFNASSLSNGIYYCNIKTNEYTKTTKMIIIK